MKSFWKGFCLRGLMVSCAGPILVAIIYVCIAASGNLISLTPYEVCTAIVSSAIMAFVAAGITAIYTIEKLPLIWAVLVHAGILYVDYLAGYLLNAWLPFAWKSVGIFTGSYIVGYALIWLCIYLGIRRRTKKINEQIQSL